eukprot:354767-Chlamydomonas_euryale.AAC.1
MPPSCGRLCVWRGAAQLLSTLERARHIIHTELGGDLGIAGEQEQAWGARRNMSDRNKSARQAV